MCGIAGIYVKNPDDAKKPKHRDKMERMLDELLLGIESRGRDATGFVAASADRHLIVDKSPIKASDFIKIRKKFPEEARIVLGHTRLATKGNPSNWLNNHPVIYEGIMVIHNGIISNDNSIFKDEELKRYAEVDSEAIAAILKKSGMQNAEEGLSKLYGGFACAAFDINDPNELILFRNGSSSNPLVYHENKQFLVWASTPKAIKEAWAKVLGTPPAWAKFEHLEDNTILRIKDDVVEIKEKAIKSRSFSGYSSSGWDDFEWGETCDTPFYIDRGESSKTPDIIEGVSHVSDIFDKSRKAPDVPNSQLLKDCQRTVQAKRNRKALTWDDRLTMSDELKQELGPQPPWDHCITCKTTVLRRDTQKNSRFGLICLDCVEFLAKELAKDIKATKDLINSPYTELEVIDGIEDYAQLEAYVHYNTMRRIEDFTGMSLHAIDYVLHRSTPEYRSKPGVKKIYDDLVEKYEEENAFIWEQYASNFDEDKGEPSANFVACASGTHHKDDDCEACTDTNTELRMLTETTTVGDKPQTPLVSSVSDSKPTGASTWADGPNRSKDRKLKGYVPRMSAHTPQWKPGDPIKGREKQDGKCLLCPKNAKVLIDRDFRWCANHFNFCGMLAEEGAKCTGETVGWNEHGVRVCHKHSRGVKNFVTQKTLRNIRDRVALSTT